MAQRTPVTRVSKGYTVFQYRFNKASQWEEKRPQATGWSRVRTPNPEATINECIARLEAQGFVREN